jgi:hypothetical protein
VNDINAAKGYELEIVATHEEDVLVLCLITYDSSLLVRRFKATNNTSIYNRINCRAPYLTQKSFKACQQRYMEKPQGEASRSQVYNSLELEC